MPEKDVRTMSEKIQDNPQPEKVSQVVRFKTRGRPAKSGVDIAYIRENLSGILDFFEESRPDVKPVALYKLIAGKLNRITGAAWSWRYVQGVHAGTIAPSHKMAMAVGALGAALDERPAVVTYTVQVIVYAKPGAVEANSVILGESRDCERPGCPVSFVPNVPWRKYCSAECSSVAHKTKG